MVGDLAGIQTSHLPNTSHKCHWKQPTQFCIILRCIGKNQVHSFKVRRKLKLIVTQLVRNLPTFHATLRFINIFIRACHWTLFWARWIQPKPSHPTFYRYTRNDKMFALWTVKECTSSDTTNLKSYETLVIGICVEK
jgi:hypothetical protein